VRARADAAHLALHRQVVLDRDRDAEQRQILPQADPGRGALGLHPRAIGTDDAERVELRIDPRDAVEHELDERDGIDVAGADELRLPRRAREGEVVGHSAETTFGRNGMRRTAYDPRTRWTRAAESDRRPDAVCDAAPSHTDFLRRTAHVAAGTTSARRSAKAKPKRKAPAKKVVCKKPRKGASRKQTSAYKKCLARQKKAKPKRPVAKAPVRPLSPAAPPPTTPDAPLPTPPARPPRPAGLELYTGPFGTVQAERLLWRAGFGPKGRADAERLAALGLEEAVRTLVRPAGAASLVGPAPVALAPRDAWSHDHCWWLDRMVRSDQQLSERLTLVFHDWFATSTDKVGQWLAIDQNELLRRRALGSFRDLVMELTVDPAMLVWLDGIENRRFSPNESYARELMELFTLGADRGAYTERDVRELARALTGWRADWSEAEGRLVNFRLHANWQDRGTKTLWAGTPHQRVGAFDWRAAVDLCLDNPYHRSFFVLKLWSYFVPTPPSPTTQAALEHLYVTSGRSIADVVEAILLHPDFHTGPAMVKPPVVLAAGLLRAAGRGVTTTNWGWRADPAGQRLFFPPNVSGWKDQAWLDTSTHLGRWELVYEAMNGAAATSGGYAGSTETPAEAVAAALRFWGDPTIGAGTMGVLTTYANQARPSAYSQSDFRAMRQNGLRHLIASSPDFQVC